MWELVIIWCLNLKLQKIYWLRGVAHSPNTYNAKLQSLKRLVGKALQNRQNPPSEPKSLKFLDGGIFEGKNRGLKVLKPR